MTVAIVCQRCSAPLPAPGATSPFVACSYCGTTHTVATPELALPPAMDGPREAELRRQAIDKAWDDAVAHGRTPVVALRAVVAARSAGLKDEAEAERAARLAEAVLRGFDAANGLATLPAAGAADKNLITRVAEAAVKAVVELRSTQETEINLPFLFAAAQGPLHLSRRVTRGDLELLDRTGSLEVHEVAGPTASSATADRPPAPPKRKWWPFG